MNEKEVCGSCGWFRSESGTKVDSEAAVYVRDRLNQSPGQRVAVDGGSVVPIYGKCRAEFTDRQGKFARFDSGNLSTSPCRATDDGGNRLYKPK